MFLEGEVNWVLVLGVLAGVSTLVAILSLGYALTRRGRHVSTSDELDLVQKVAEAADKRLFQTLNAIPVALVETDKQGKFVFANRAAHQLLGRRDAELIGLRFHSATWGITYPDGRPVPPDLLPSARALRGQTVKGFQHAMANPATRRKMLVSVTALPIEDEYGTVIGSTAAIVETESLTTPEIAPSGGPAPDGGDLTRRVFEAASSALVVVSADGVIREVNPTALERLGRVEGVVGGDFADQFLAEDERVEGRQSLRAALIAPPGLADPIMSRGAFGTDIAWRILPLADVDGRIDALLLAGEPVGTIVAEPAAPAPVAAEGLAVESDPGGHQAELDALRRDRDAARAEADVALAQVDRVRAEARAESEAGRRLENVGRLTGGVAHDFNALLAVMTSALDMLLKQADDPARVRRLGQAALAAGQRGEALTRRLSAFSQGEDGEATRTLDGGVLLRAMETRLRALAGPGVDLLIEGPSVPALVRLDPVAFEGAVKALVANAVEAVGEGGSIAVRLEATPEGARLSVRDSGPGMDGDTAARAREPFFTTKTGAAGLGLAQAYAFARQSGGTLTIDSAPGEGAEVAVTLPAAA
jgi:PAS domain S-box-containing protein